MQFSTLKLKPALLKWIAEVWYVETTDIQEQVIPLALEWRNIVWQSQTWTGKTVAFLLPILNNIDTNTVKPQALIISPTRELVVQTYDEIYKLTNYYRVPACSIYGWASQVWQLHQLKRNPRIIVATPWRLLDFIQQWVIDLGSIKYFVLDEVDRMLDMGFLPDIKKIWAWLSNVKQVLSFSATLDTRIMWILDTYLKDYETIKSWEEILVDKLNHSYMLVDNKDKFINLTKALVMNKDKKIIVFTNTRHSSTLIYERLSQEWYKIWVLNWDLKQSKRLSTLESFTKWKIKIIVTTDVAARWLNMDNIWLVINYEVPKETDSYIHRIWRTARAGESGNAIMFVSSNEVFLMKNIEKVYKFSIPKSEAVAIKDSEWIYWNMKWRPEKKPIKKSSDKRSEEKPYVKKSWKSNYQKIFSKKRFGKK